MSEIHSLCVLCMTSASMYLFVIPLIETITHMSEVIKKQLFEYKFHRSRIFIASQKNLSFKFSLSRIYY